MQRVQTTFGQDHVAVLLLSVDQSYGFSDLAGKNKDLLAARGLGWPNVLVPEGWRDIERVFNLSGYGLTVVDHEGIVRGVDLFRSGLLDLVSDLYAAKLTAAGKNKDGHGR